MSYAVGDKVIIACFKTQLEKSPLNGHTCTIKRILHNMKTKEKMYEIELVERIIRVAAVIDLVPTCISWIPNSIHSF